MDRNSNGVANGAPSSSPVANDGRTAAGRFAVGNRLGRQFEPGNKAGRGNASFCKLAAARAAIMDAVTPEEIGELFRDLYRAAREGDRDAAKLVLAYRCGKPAVAEDPDSAALRELQLAAKWPGAVEVLALLLGHLDATEAVNRIRQTGNPALFRDLADKLAAEKGGKR